MPELGAHNYDVQGCQFLLEFKPKQTAIAGNIETFRILDHHPFVQSQSRFAKEPLDLLRRMRDRAFRQLKLRWQSQAVEAFATLPQRSLEQRLAVQPEKIEYDKSHRHIGRRASKEILALILATQAFLQIEKGEPSAFLKGDDFAVGD